MTTEAQTIPEDILATAAELVNATIRNYERNEFENVSRDAIAKAIFAERERCASIADHFSQSSLFSDWPDAARGAGYYACGDIAEAIRHPKTAVAQSADYDDDDLPF